MPAYATTADLTLFAVPAAALAGITPADIEKHLEAASSKADSYLGVVFRLPLLTWGDDLKEAVANIAAYFILGRRGFSPERGSADTLKEKHDSAIAWLKDVVAGKAIPVDVKDSSPAGLETTVPKANMPMALQPTQGGIGLAPYSRLRTFLYGEDDFSDDAEDGVQLPRRRGF